MHSIIHIIREFQLPDALTDGLVCDYEVFIYKGHVIFVQRGFDSQFFLQSRVIMDGSGVDEHLSSVFEPKIGGSQEVCFSPFDEGRV